MNKPTLPIGLAILLAGSIGCAGPAPLEYAPASNSVQIHQLQAPLTPDQTLTRLIVPEGFTAHVFASEPDIVNPIALAWDERGRLWVVESTNYPHDHVGEETGQDRITICEDTDGDYKADRFIRFAENQPLTTGIALVREGAVVGQAPDMVLLQDTDGDDIADTRRILIDDAFGTFDTHAVMSNLKVGLDNHIWGAVGYSAMYRPGEAPDPAARILTRGIFRFRPDGSELEPVAEFNNNTWGLGIGEDNTIYGSTANNNHAVVVGIPLRYGTGMNVEYVQSHYLVRHSSPRQLQQVDYRDGYTAAAGAFPYNGRRYPPLYWGALMVAEPTAHVVHANIMEPYGSIYREREGEILNVLASEDEWVAPVFVEIGPDENLWVADWYNPVIQHNPDTRGMVNQIWNAERGPGNAHLNPLRDRQHGRVYFLAYGEPAPDAITSLSADDPDGLIGALESTNQFWRLTAQRLIVEHQLSELEPRLTARIASHLQDDTGLDAGAVHALWTLHGLGAEDALQSVARSGLTHPSAAVRKAAVETLPISSASAELLVHEGLFADPQLNVRLAAVLKAIDLGLQAYSGLLPAVQSAVTGADKWIATAVSAFSPIGIVENPPYEAPPPPPVPAALPPARLELTAPEGVMRFAEPTLHAFAGQEIHVDFVNLHPDLHNAVFLLPDANMDAFGAALDLYMTDPESSDNEYVPPARQHEIVGSTGVLPQHERTVAVLGVLEAGSYPFVCSVPGHWAVMQGTLTVTEAPELSRNDAGWTWPGSDPALPSIVYLAGSSGRQRQSHHHARVFGFADGQILYGTGHRTYTYTEASDAAFRASLGNAALLALANNKPIPDPASRAAIFAHVEAGRPLLVTHPASWYNWSDWPEYNRQLIGGGSRSHEPLQTFTVEVVQPHHPLMQGVPANFDIVDELYRAELLPDARAIVVATGRSHETGAVFPVIWVRHVGEATIVVNTLGHDDRAHDLPAYKQIIANARDWLLNP
ncbi:MAG: ThuA domain-containing protein [Bacteroidota bacterium]|nr:ThuA domain-containing protein [Bacteroidota bacterium]